MSRLNKGEYKVLFQKKNNLYVEYAGEIAKVENPFETTPSTVDIVEVDGIIYVKGFEPKKKPAPKKKKLNKEEK